MCDTMDKTPAQSMIRGNLSRPVADRLRQMHEAIFGVGEVPACLQRSTDESKPAGEFVPSVVPPRNTD